MSSGRNDESLLVVDENFMRSLDEYEFQTGCISVCLYVHVIYIQVCLRGVKMGLSLRLNNHRDERNDDTLSLYENGTIDGVNGMCNFLIPLFETF